MGRRADFDPEPMFLDVGFFNRRKHTPLMEVYLAHFSSNDTENDWIHDFLKIPHSNPSLHHYLGETGSTEINSALRENWLHETEIPHHIKEHIKAIDPIFHEEKELPRTLKLYSGLAKSPVTNAGFEWNSTRKNKIIRLPGFTSTSTSPSKSIEFANLDNTTKHHESDHHGVIKSNARHALELEFTHRIHDAASVLDHSRNPSEKEVLLGRGHEFILHARPTLIKQSGFSDPIYMWKSTTGIYLPTKVPL